MGRKKDEYYLVQDSSKDNELRDSATLSYDYSTTNLSPLAKNNLLNQDSAQTLLSNTQKIGLSAVLLLKIVLVASYGINYVFLLFQLIIFAKYYLLILKSIKG